MLTLYKEEMRAALRGRFAWLGAGVVLLCLGVLAAIASQDTWLDGYGVIAYFLAPTTFLPLTAGIVASPRANRCKIFYRGYNHWPAWMRVSNASWPG